jgi:hypothetical protein
MIFFPLSIDSTSVVSYNPSMKKIQICILLSLSFAISYAQTPIIDTSKIAYAPMDSFNIYLDVALKAIAMRRADLTFRGDYLEEDPYRLPMINDLMREPLKIIDYSRRQLAIRDFSQLRYGELTREDNFPVISKDTLNAKFVPYVGVQASKDIQIPGQNENIFYAGRDAENFVSAENKSKFGIDLMGVFDQLFGLAKFTELKNWPIFDNYKKPQLDSMVQGFTMLLEENVDDEFRTPDQLDSIAQYEDSWAANLIELAKNAKGRGKMIDTYLDFLSWSPAKDSSFVQRIPSSAWNTTIQTPFGKIVIGDTSNNIYSGDLFIVVDPGGNDTYNIAFDGTGHQTYIIDYSGDDIYNLPKNRISPYFYGANMIIDMSGDDIYNAGSWSLGAGLFGIGILWDKSGNDKYFGDTFTEGAGCFGVGILRDDGGNDFYTGALYAQGFGSVDGIGVLLDDSGNDSYFAGGKYKDILRYKDHYLSLSQGFAYGIRPKMSGGVGMLVDKSGNDTYVSDIFGQGSSYWYSLGVLADGGGNDQYASFQYAQGAATHMTLGILYDASGDDNYSSKGVSQGCGHDRAAGILLDLAGNDNYTAYDLSQAAGSANGIGILADISGNDSYVVRSDQNTQGFGQVRRDYGSIGVFLDLQGKDSYSGSIGRDSTWWSDSNWGIGIDK